MKSQSDQYPDKQIITMLMIGSVYPDFLSGFYSGNEIQNLGYEEHLDRVLYSSAGFIASYTRHFKDSGINVIPILTNDSRLQDKWRKIYPTSESGNLLIDQLEHYQPDIIWIEDIKSAGTAFLRHLRNSRNPGLTVLYHCAPVNTDLKEKLPFFDLVITCTPGLKKVFEEYGSKTHLVYHAFDPDFVESIPGNKKIERHQVIFSGSLRQGKGYHAGRIQLLNFLVSRGVPLSIFSSAEGNRTLLAKKALRVVYKLMKSAGFKNPESFSKYLEYGTEDLVEYSGALISSMKKPVHGIEMYSHLANSLIVLNNHGDVAGEYAGNMRLFEATGMGSCLLTDSKKNLGDLFEIDKEVMAYENAADCANKIKWLLEHEDDRKKIAEAGKKRTLTSHTVASRCRILAEILRKELDALSRPK